MQFTKRGLAGLLAFAAGTECIIGISIAEELYPSYSVSANYISDLGATCKASCVIVEPSSTIFNASVALLGALGMAVGYLLYRSTHNRLLVSFLILSAVGAIGVGFFPETTGIVHRIFSLVVFLFGGLAAIASSRILELPMSYLSVLIGIITIVSLGLDLSGTYLGLGPGGMERMVAYPALLWFVGFGSYLMKS